MASPARVTMKSILAVLLLLSSAVCAQEGGEQDAVVYQAQDVVCTGVKRAFYSTALEFDNDPCNFSCTYDAETGALQAQCRYDYCEACDTTTGDCGVRVVEISTTLTEDTLNTFTDGLGDLDIGSQKKYCVDYTQGTHVEKMICIVVDDSFQSNVCEDDETASLPLLACSDNGCDCASSAGTATMDPSSTYIGFATLDFGACYGVSPPVEEEVAAPPPAIETSSSSRGGITDGTKSASSMPATTTAVFAAAGLLMATLA